MITRAAQWPSVKGVTDARAARRLRTERIQDVALGVVLFVAAEIALWATHPEPGEPRWARMLLAGIATLPLVARRRWPVAVWVLSGGATLGLLAGHGSVGPAVFAPLIALYTVATTTERRVSIGAGVVSLIGVLVAVAAQSPTNHWWPKFLFPIIVVAACWLVGDNLRVRRAYVAELEAKAARAEADRAAELAHAAAQERTRIARELHDVVVHHVSVIAVQAGAARMLSEQNGAEAGTSSWAAVETTARQALAELRQLLGVLRRDRTVPLEPQPGLAQLDRLIQDVRHAGLPVEVVVDGDLVELAGVADLSAYRILQEALTNVVKHEGAAPTTVSLHYRRDELDIEVVNQPAPRPPARPLTKGPGHGLIGMQERLAMLGGSLEAGPRPTGGFRVAARLPTAEPAP
jgi:signal transduction histidine kinase